MRRSWAAKGRTPGVGGHRKNVSAVGAVGVSPASRPLGRYFATRPDGYFDAGAAVAFLRDLLRPLRGNVVVVWEAGRATGGRRSATCYGETGGCGWSGYRSTPPTSTQWTLCERGSRTCG